MYDIKEYNRKRLLFSMQRVDIIYEYLYVM